MNFQTPLAQILVDMRRKNINETIKAKYPKDLHTYIKENNVELVYDIIKEYNWNFFQRAFKGCEFEIKWTRHNSTAIYKKSEIKPTSLLMLSKQTFKHELTNKELFGVTCVNNLYALQVIIEHQLIHSLIFMKLNYKPILYPTHKIVPTFTYHNDMFQILSKNIFQHKNFKKSLRF